MNFLSINVRGIGEDYKVNWVRRLRSQHRVSFLAVQESQILDAKKIDVAACWGNQDVDFVRLNATGCSGGLINMWDKRVFTQVESIYSRNYIITKGTWSGIQEPLYFANIYGPH